MSAMCRLRPINCTHIPYQWVMPFWKLENSFELVCHCSKQLPTWCFLKKNFEYVCNRSDRTRNPDFPRDALWQNFWAYVSPSRTRTHGFSSDALLPKFWSLVSRFRSRTLHFSRVLSDKKLLARKPPFKTQTPEFSRLALQIQLWDGVLSSRTRTRDFSRDAI